MSTSKAIFRVVIEGKIEAVWHELTKAADERHATDGGSNADDAYRQALVDNGMRFRV